MAAHKDSNSRILRWFLELQPFSFQVRHIPGAQQGPADYLSRFPCSSSVLEQDRSWDGVCDRAVPITSSALVVPDVSDSSDTSFPRSRVAEGTLSDGGSRRLVAGETPEGFRAAAVKRGCGQKIGEREGEGGRREMGGKRAGPEEERRIIASLTEDEALEKETGDREPQLTGHPRAGHDPGGSWLAKVTYIHEAVDLSVADPPVIAAEKRVYVVHDN
ncbi:hypothetical protein NDU88_005502 [Pleurodeles waltl]|uniref:Uncharacterized protein n=1 Tax=Pleurodeles waltl TaxID=8319 RepID=A0AAV7SLU9_PLEWA|nr:hypothetical protein NDU88_005502 [Pleurodeles waltl]